jgi:hypothetical protein
MISAHELRFVVVAEDDEAAVRPYRDVFGLKVPMGQRFRGRDGLQLTMFQPR